MNNPDILKGGNIDNIKKIRIFAYEPAFGIIGDSAKSTPKTRQSADHSMAFIISATLRHAFKNHSKL